MEGTAANRVICNTRDQNTKHIVTYLPWLLMPLLDVTAYMWGIGKAAAIKALPKGKHYST